MERKKYEFTGETIEHDGHILNRIRALIDFDGVKKGDIGGWIESEHNLSHNGNSWVYDDAKVYEHAQVFHDAKVYYRAKIYGNAEVGVALRYTETSKCLRTLGSAVTSKYAMTLLYMETHIYTNTVTWGKMPVYSVKLSLADLCA